MSGGGSGQSQSSTEPWSGQKNHLKSIYRRAHTQSTRPQAKQYDEVGTTRRLNYTNDITGIDARNADQVAGLGMDAGATQTAVGSGGFVPFTAYEQEAQQGAVDLARGGVDPSLIAAQQQLAGNQGIAGLGGGNAASGYLDQTAGGSYLTPDSNPYLRGAVEAAQDPVVSRFNEEILPGISGQFGASGGFGGAAHQRAVGRATDDLTRNLSNASTQAYANAYGQERGLQQGAQQALGQLDLSQNQALAEAVQRNAAISPALAGAVRGQQMGNLSLLEGVGGAQGELARQLGTMGASPYDFRANENRDRLRQYAQLIQGGPQFSTQTGSGGGKNKTAGALGGAATGAATGAMVGGPWGAAAGGVIGGVGGYFL